MNIKEYYGFEDSEYPEHVIYYWMKNNTSWKLLVLKIRIIELIDTVWPNLYSWINKMSKIYPRLFTRLKYPTDKANMVNKWEK